MAVAAAEKLGSSAARADAAAMGLPRGGLPSVLGDRFLQRSNRRRGDAAHGCAGNCNLQRLELRRVGSGSLPATYYLHPVDDREEDLTALERCKEKLPQAQKVSIQLFYMDEKCYKEIADATGYTMNEVKSYIQNGKRNLKLLMERKLTDK